MGATRRIESLFLAGAAGRLEALLEEPDDGDPRLAALVCHPHPLFGGTMHNKAVYRIARGLRRAGAVVLRFNFRGVNRSEGKHDDGRGEVDDARIAIETLRARYPDLPWMLAGFSFGARVILRLGCREPGARLLLAAGFPARLADTTEFVDCPTPRLFMQSTNDEYGPRAVMEEFFGRATGEKRLSWIESKDHFFAGGLDELEAAVTDAGRSCIR